MKHWWIAVADLIASHRTLRAPNPRGIRRVELSCQPLEERVTPSHSGGFHHLADAVHVHQEVGRHARESSTTLRTTTTLPTTTSPGTLSIPLPGGVLGNTSSPTSTPVGWGHVGRGSHSTNSALQTALQNLRTEVQTIELASATTVGELTAIRVAFHTLSSDGLTPSSYSALQSFENSLVTANASGTTLAGNTTLLKQFEALYTSSPTTQQTTDLTTAYSALAAAVTSAGVTSSDITTINTDWSTVLAAANSTSASTFPYFSLVAGQGVGVCDGPMAV